MIFARSFNQNVSASLDSLVMETTNPYKNKLYRAVSRLSVSSMDLSQPSVASRKELWEGRAKNNQPCRNCQVNIPSDWGDWKREAVVRDFMDMTKNEEAFLASRPNSPPLRKGKDIQYAPSLPSVYTRTLRPKGEDAHDYTGGVYSGYNQETYL